MKIKNNFDVEIKPFEWLYLVAALILIILAINGNLQEAAELLKHLMPTAK